MNKDFEMGCVMGLIWSDGGFTGDRKPRLTMKKKEDLDLLQCCVSMLGGRINGPYAYTYKDGTERRYHMWCLDGKALIDALPTMDQYLPVSAKRDVYLEWKKRYKL